MLIALLRLFVVMQRYTIAQAKSREKGKNIFRKNKMAHVAWWRYCGFAAAGQTHQIELPVNSLSK